MTVKMRMKDMKMGIPNLFIIFLTIICSVQSSIIKMEGEKAKSLYDHNDKVFVLTNENFYQTVFDQPYGSNIEFYNSFCGFCRNFAPTYKAFADDVYEWRNFVRISAIDCADDANNDICRDMEIMRYPTLRYFSPHYRNASNHLGIEVIHDPVTVGEPHSLELLANSSMKSSSWPNLQPIETTSVPSLFNSLPKHIQFIFIVYDPKNTSIVAQKVALDLHAVKEIEIRRVTSVVVASKLGLNQPSALYVGVKSSSTIEMLKHLNELDRNSIRSIIEFYLKSKGIQIQFDKTTNNQTKPTNEVADVSEKDLAVFEYVRAHPQMVFQSDIETAIRYVLFVELGKFGDIGNEQIAALKGFVTVLHKYSPLGDNGNRFLTDLKDYVENAPKLTRRGFKENVKQLEKKYHPVFSSSEYIGCKPSIETGRGFTCGLWQLFHYLTVQATNSDKSHEPLEVLRAIHGFVKHYFGCTACSEHFQEMAERNNIWKVSTKDEAVLWLWSAHNEVNRRLAGDSTEDPMFPKIQYPSQVACSQCYQQVIPVQGITPADSEIPLWNSGEVLYYLRRVYSLFNLSRNGVDHESILPEMLTSSHSSKLQSSTSSGFAGALSEMDVRMGILLYAFCMLIIVVAVKLFLHRGYRKETYTHDFFGKI